MPSAQELAELLPLYEEYHYATDPGAPSVRTAKLVFDSDCKKIYERESEALRSKMTLNDYVANVVIQEINQFRKQRTSRYPTIQPEKNPAS